MKIFKKWWFWLIAIIVVVAMASGGGEEETATKVDGEASKASKASKASEASATEKKQDEKAAPAKEEFAVGEKVQLEDNVLTVTKVEKSPGSEFDQPKDGHEYVIVTVEIENAGDENISYNPFDFKMSNSQGQIVDQAFTTVDTNTALQSGELAPGGKVSGTISFEQPAGDAGLQLQYNPSFWSDKTIKVNLH
ncbi:DUF4352 domain-containing protein [Mesobacillus subterraneus]|uniref:DUF4352 domain-containing protein n=1 Tax=Mesobacillus subterraneus TaxID=285983 RepID=A0A3R9F151_9BACI|nr:DUF4352 domain-containing protein [Mesobacillus subterraneus]RSD26817.1 DUF4352 domain-containing protein [Mesobacillus subterraneus]